MTSTAPAKTVAAAMMHGGAYTALVESLAQEVVDTADLSSEHASDVLLALGASQGDDAAASTPSIVRMTRSTLLPNVQIGAGHEQAQLNLLTKLQD